MINLWEHQAALNLACRQSMMKGNRSVLIQAATGFGKTRAAAAQIETAINKKKLAYFVVPRRQLLQQTSEAFTALGIRHGYISSGREYWDHQPCYLATAGTLHNRMAWLPVPSVVFIDEAHFGAKQLGSIIAFYRAKGSYIVGLSATPWKLSGKGLGEWFDDMVCGEGIDWLIEHGYLSDYKLYAPSAPNLKGIKTSAGDYNKGQLAALMESEARIVGDAVRHYKKNALGKRNITFCTSIRHSQMVADAFNEAGVPTRHVDGSMGGDEVKQIIKDYAGGVYMNLCCAQLLQFGFDLAQAAGMDDVTVEAISDMEPTKSLAKQMQKWGRALRRKPEPAIINDHAGNTIQHGLPDDPREWTLDDRVHKKAQGERTIPTRQCSKCFHVHRPAPKCPSCGYIYPVQSREVEEVDGELAEIDKEAARKAARREQGQAKGLDELIALGKSRGYKNPYAWASKVWTARRAKGR